MVDIVQNITRAGRTDIAGSIDITPSGGSSGKAIVAADLVDGFNKKTVAFAAGETEKPVTFPVADDTEYEGTETYRLTMSNPQPSGVLPDPPYVEGTILDNETAPPSGGTIVYPVGSDPASTADTGLRNAGGPHKISGKMVPGFTITFGMNADGTDGFKIVYLDGTGRFKALTRVNGNDSDVPGYNYNALTGVSDTPTDFEITFGADGRTTFIYGGTTLINAVRLNGETKTGTYARAQHASAQPTVITRLS